jgi:hypothetical protein
MTKPFSSSWNKSSPRQVWKIEHSILNEALHPPRNPTEQESTNIMKIKTIKRIATTSLAMILLHCKSFAGSPIVIHLPQPAALAIAARKPVPCVRHAATTTGSQTAGQPAPSHQFDAGENSFTIGHDWFRG